MGKSTKLSIKINSSHVSLRTSFSNESKALAMLPSTALELHSDLSGAIGQDYHVIFHCLKLRLDDFSRMSIEIIGNLL